MRNILTTFFFCHVRGRHLCFSRRSSDFSKMFGQAPRKIFTILGVSHLKMTIMAVGELGKREKRKTPSSKLPLCC